MQSAKEFQLGVGIVQQLDEFILITKEVSKDEFVLSLGIGEVRGSLPLSLTVDEELSRHRRQDGLARASV